MIAGNNYRSSTESVRVSNLAENITCYGPGWDIKFIRNDRADQTTPDQAKPKVILLIELLGSTAIRQQHTRLVARRIDDQFNAK